MAAFYLDHDVSAQTAVYLRLDGHDVVTARQLRQERAPDYQQLLTAAGEGRIFITHNEAHFLLLHGAWCVWSASWQVEPKHSGILIIPQWTPTLSQWGPSRAARELTRLVDEHSTLTNVLYIWRRSPGWEAIRP